MLLWSFLIFTTIISLFKMVGNIFSFPPHDPSVSENWVIVIPALVIFVTAPLSGWLADAKFGNFKVFQVGAVLLFIFTVVNCLLMILKELFWESSNVLEWIH